MRWLLSRLGYWSRAGRSAPRTTSTVRISRSGRPRQHGERRSRGSAAPAAGGVIGRGCAGWRRGIAAASTTPTIKLPSRSSPSRSGRGRDLGGRRPQGHHRAGRGSGAELAVAAVAPHPPSASIARQGRAGRHRRAAGGRAGHLLHLPCLSPAGPQAQRPRVSLPNLYGVPTLVEHRRAGILPARRDRRRHLYDQRRRGSCLASGHPPGDPASRGCRSPRVPDLAPGEDHAASPNRATLPEGALVPGA
jgi:hypothetical protein